METPDLIGVLAGALSNTTRELNALADLTEQAQLEAGRLATRARTGGRPLEAEDFAELERRLDALAAWQISEVRDRRIHERARARGLLEEVGPVR